MPRLDYLLLVLGSGLLMAGLNAMLRRRANTRLPVLAWVMVGATLVFGWFVVEYAAREEREEIRRQVSTLAPTYATELERMGHAEIGPDTAPNDPRYLAMIEAQLRWLKLNPGISDIYTMRRFPDGRVVLVVDSETDYDHNGRYEGERERRTPIGEPYTETDPDLQRAFGGQATFAAKPVTDRWGTWVSAFVPMRDAQGRQEAVLGADYDAAQWQRQIAAVRWPWVGMAAVLVLLQAGGAAMIARLRAELAARRQSEAALRESEERFRQIAHNVTEVFWMTDPHKNQILYISPAYETIWARTCASLYAEPNRWLEAVHPDDQERVRQALSRQASGGYDVEYRIVRPDGSMRWIRDRAFPVRDAAGDVYRVTGIAEDITERHRTDEERVRLSMAVEQAAELIVITDARGTIQYVNPAFERVSGYSRAEAIGQNPRILKSGSQDAEFYRHLWATIKAGQVWSGHFVNRRKDGSLYEEEAVISPVRDAAGTIINFVSVKRDVTAERQLQRQFLQAQKMDAVGRLAGGVAHDFNNILTAIMGYSERLVQGLDSRHPLQTDAREIERAAYRAARLTRQLLAFSRRQVLQPKVVDLNAIVESMDRMLRRLIGEHIALCSRPAAGLGSVKADVSQIEQVILNLVVNARDAMPDGGKLLIETANVTLNESYAATHPEVVPGDYVMLAVTDTGCGLSDEARRHIFEPFFTTKAQGKGTGLGLATCYGILKQSGGHINVYSELGHGTTFKVYLPCVNAAPDQRLLPPEQTAAVPRGSEVLLLVEDEPAVRELATLALTDLGYTVLTATNGIEALELVRRRDSGRLDLLVTDVVMPQMGGRELADRLRALRPDTKVLFTSGYTEDAIVNRGVLQPGLAFLQKPYTPGTLARKIRQVLDG